MLMRSILCRLAKEKGHRVRVMGVLSAVEHIFNETAMHTKAMGSNRVAKANIASHAWSKSEPSLSGKGKSKENKGKSKGTKSAKDSHKGKTSKTGLSGLENSKSEACSDIQESAQTCTTDTFWNNAWNCNEWNDGWRFDEWNDYWSSVGRHEGWEQTYDTSASSFSLGGLDVSATSSSKRFEWVKMKLDTGSAVTSH